ncbi:MAG: hypothetical protein OSA84_04170 [Akkermansiaceae bacterium]|nr:hypothetical protein [Akkermansiaceae bacterium]
MKIETSFLAFAAISAFGAVSTQAATLANFDFAAESLNSAATPITGITVTAVSTGSSFNTFTSSTGWDSAAQVSGATSFFSGSTTQGAAGNALVFTITAASGYSFFLDSFSFQARSTSAAPADIGFTVSATSYDFASSYSNDSMITNISNPALGLTGLTSAVISIQGWNSSGSSELQLDNLIASGTVIPEPSAAILGAIGMLALLRRRR